jgi:hypothetical protein
MPRLFQFAALAAALSVGLAVSTASASPQTTGFNYQGVLNENGAPVNGTIDIECELFDAGSGGSHVGAGFSFSGLQVIDGVFSLFLDFGVNPYTTGERRWLELRVRPTGSGDPYTTLSRQELWPTPYSLSTRGINVSSDGNVGIGTDGPYKPLTIEGGTTFAPLRIDGDVNPGLEIKNRNAPSSWSLYHDGLDNLIFRDTADGMTRMSISGDMGRIGIGTVNPQSTLDVNTSGNFLGIQSFGTAAAITLDNTDDADTRWTISALANDKLQIRDTWSGVNVMVLDAISQRVGIGTSTPSTRLHVQYTGGNGVEIEDTSPTSTSIGMFSKVGLGTGVRGESISETGATYGVYGATASPNGWGVFSNGRFGSTGTKSFVIDHPLDPTNGYLIHYSSESPEPQNRYSGNVVLDERGVSAVVLPEYFGSINAEFRYLLTPIGGAAPNLHIAQEISANTFVIAGGRPGMKVSWEVVARRNDRFVAQRGAPVELLKTGNERGRYLMPELYNQPREKGLFFESEPVSAP